MNCCAHKTATLTQIQHTVRGSHYLGLPWLEKIYEYKFKQRMTTLWYASIDSNPHPLESLDKDDSELETCYQYVLKSENVIRKLLNLCVQVQITPYNLQFEISMVLSMDLQLFDQTILRFLYFRAGVWVEIADAERSDLIFVSFTEVPVWWSNQESGTLEPWGRGASWQISYHDIPTKGKGADYVHHTTPPPGFLNF